MVNKYYDLATSFYEYGWGESFHFAHRYKWETLRESIVRHEHFLASKLNVKPGDKVLDVGCGVGGPLREIAAFTGASVTGLNNNAFQIKRGEEMNAATRMINVRIRNMTLRSTRKAFMNVRLRCTQSKTRKLSLPVSATSTRVVVIICGSAV